MLFGLCSINIYLLNNAADSGSAPRFVSIDKWGVLTIYLSYASLLWFIAAYTHAVRLTVPLLMAGLYVGIALFKSWSPHLILMDIRMPRMDGISRSNTFLKM